jgi:hypothetical protein
LTAADVDFLVSAVAPDVTDKERLKRLIEVDGDFRDAFIDDDRTFRKVVADRDVFLRISPRLYFEVLLRKTRRELESATHTIEKGGTQKVAVFDTKDVVDLLSRQAVLVYLSDMLSSFARIESYTFHYRIREGIWRKLRFNDLDVDSLIGLCASVEEEHRLGFYKRIADICLFTLGVFPEHVRYSWRYPASGEPRPAGNRRLRRSVGDYLEEGRKFYKLAADHPATASLEVSQVFRLLHENFLTARKPLAFIAENYIRQHKGSLFES